MKTLYTLTLIAVIILICTACTSTPKLHIYKYPTPTEFAQRESDERRAQELSIETFLILGTRTK